MINGMTWEVDMTHIRPSVLSGVETRKITKKGNRVQFCMGNDPQI